MSGGEGSDEHDADGRAPYVNTGMAYGLDPPQLRGLCELKRMRLYRME